MRLPALTLPRLLAAPTLPRLLAAPVLAAPVLAAAVLAAAALLAGCRPAEPRPLRYGEDVCAHCRMTASDPRFGAELVTATGKVYPFDAIECLAQFVLAHPELEAETQGLWVTAYDAPGALLPLENAYFVRAPDVRSPMGLDLAAFATETPEAEARAAFEGAEVLTWAEVLALAGRAEADPAHAHPTPTPGS